MTESKENELSLDELRDVSGGLKGDHVMINQLKGDRVSPNQLKGDHVMINQLKGKKANKLGMGADDFETDKC